MKTHVNCFGLFAMLTILSAGLCGCGTAKISSQHPITATPVAKPAMVYVPDFDLDAASIKSERGVLPPPPKLPDPLGDVLPSIPCTPKGPQVLARELIDAMSTSLVNDLTKAGLKAHRLPRSGALPANGWLVRGVFTEVNQGNQLRRAVIGFGAGKTDLQVIVDISDLAQGTPRRFYELSATADSGRAPGAGPMIALCPAGAAARFVIAGNDLNRSVKQTASKIAEEVVHRTQTVPQISTAHFSLPPIHRFTTLRP